MDSVMVLFLCQVLVVDRAKYHFCIDHLLFHLCPKRQGIRHQVVDQPRIPLGMAVDGRKRRFIYDRLTPAGTGKFVQDILLHFRVRKPAEVIMDGDPLAQRFMYRAA